MVNSRAKRSVEKHKPQRSKAVPQRKRSVKSVADGSYEIDWAKEIASIKGRKFSSIDAVAEHVAKSVIDRFGGEAVEGPSEAECVKLLLETDPEFLSQLSRFVTITRT